MDDMSEWLERAAACLEEAQAAVEETQRGIEDAARRIEAGEEGEALGELVAVTLPRNIRLVGQALLGFVDDGEDDDEDGGIERSAQEILSAAILSISAFSGACAAVLSDLPVRNPARNRAIDRALILATATSDAAETAIDRVDGLDTPVVQSTNS